MTENNFITDAEQCLLNHTPEKINDSLLKVNQEQLLNDSTLLFKYTKLRAFSFLAEGNFVKAEELCLLAYETVPAGLDIYYIMAAVNHRMKEFRLVIDYAQQYLEMHDVNKTDNSDYTAGAGCLSDIYNFLGTAYLSLHDNEIAEKYLKLSIDSDPSNYKGYINLARFYTSTRNYQAAFEILRQGIRYCGDVVELEMLQNSLYEEKTADIVS